MLRRGGSAVDAAVIEAVVAGGAAKFGAFGRRISGSLPCTIPDGDGL